MIRDDDIHKNPPSKGEQGRRADSWETARGRLDSRQTHVIPGGECGRRRCLLAASAALGAAGLGAAAIPLIQSMQPSAEAHALGSPVKINVSTIEPGRQVTVSWRGRPIWILRRTGEMLRCLNRPELTGKLRDPASSVEAQQPDYAKNETRSIRPEYLVVVSLCTHLGCIPNYLPDDNTLSKKSGCSGNYFCPCHGSRFDLAGRVVKGVPAPTNLVVPPHRFVNSSIVEIGVDHA